MREDNRSFEEFNDILHEILKEIGELRGIVRETDKRIALLERRMEVLERKIDSFIKIIVVILLFFGGLLGSVYYVNVPLP